MKNIPNFRTFITSADIRTADLVMMDIHEAVSAYEMDGFATDIALYVKPGHVAQVSEDLMKMNSAYRVQTKDLVRTYVERGLNTRGGVFTALILLPCRCHTHNPRHDGH
jgi:hypothetical protein